MAKKKFEPNKWIKFEINGFTFIGRTIKTDTGEQIVSAVDSGGNNGFIEWSVIEDNAEKLTKLSFVASDNDKSLEEFKPKIRRKSKQPKQSINLAGVVIDNCTEEEAEKIKYAISLSNLFGKIPEA